MIFWWPDLIDEARSFQLLKLENYCDDHSSLSVTFIKSLYDILVYMYVFHLQMHLSVENTYNIYAGNIGLLTYSDLA